MNERERAILDARDKGGAERRFAFNELMNFLELYAFVDNKKMLVKSSRPLISEKIADSLVVVERSEWGGEVEKAITTSDTFKELGLFALRHKRLLKKRRAEADRANAEEQRDVG